MRKVQTLLITFFCALAVAGFAQQSRLRVANSEFEKLSYPQAVRNYEAFLRSSNGNSEHNQEALTNLAFCYRKLQDTKNAERVYKELFTLYEAKLASEQFLYYAQALANNGKYRESQKYYSKYGDQQKEDIRGRKFTVAYMDNSEFYKDSSLYRIEYLYPINSRYSDFSPMYYENSLVFVSARNEGSGVKRIFNQNETPFLDLFQFADTMQLSRENRLMAAKSEQQGSLGSSGKSVKAGAKNANTSFAALEEPDIEEFSKSINSKYHEGPVTFFKDNRKLIFTRNNYSKGKTRKSEKGVNMLKLYIATKKGSKWGDIKELPFNSDDYSTGHPTLSPDNKKLYFVSDMKGGYGGTDIYVVDYKDGVWGSPVNMGREVNTEGNEMFPFMDELGNLYFASDGHAGLGGLDMFFVEFREGQPAGEVENLGAPINSDKDDFGLITRGDRSRGYFSSNRKRGYSDDNIYSFSKGCRLLNLYVYDANTNLPIQDTELRMVKNGINREMYTTDSQGLSKVCLESGADFQFKAYKEGYEAASITYGTMSSSISKNQHIKIFLETSKRTLVKGKVVSEVDQSPIPGVRVVLQNQKDGSTETVITGLDGRYTFQPEKDGNYVVSAVKDSYAKNTENVLKVKTSKRSSVVEQDLGLVGEGDIFKLENIYYDLNKSEIRSDAKRELDTKVIPILNKYPDIQIELRSHTDSRASHDYNHRLSDARAREAVKYLIKKGIDPARLVAKGYGETELVNDCEDGVSCLESDHQQNRRTEFKILAVKELYGLK
jgi:outer membrane protein OmpA-like peptidoglycan-associated protein/tetratricopeptide (TPR) repeat protein